MSVRPLVRHSAGGVGERRGEAWSVYPSVADWLWVARNRTRTKPTGKSPPSAKPSGATQASTGTRPSGTRPSSSTRRRRAGREPRRSHRAPARLPRQQSRPGRPIRARPDHRRRRRSHPPAPEADDGHSRGAPVGSVKSNAWASTGTGPEWHRTSACARAAVPPTTTNAASRTGARRVFIKSGSPAASPLPVDRARAPSVDRRDERPARPERSRRLPGGCRRRADRSSTRRPRTRPRRRRVVPVRAVRARGRAGRSRSRPGNPLRPSRSFSACRACSSACAKSPVRR